VNRGVSVFVLSVAVAVAVPVVVFAPPPCSTITAFEKDGNTSNGEAAVPAMAAVMKSLLLTFIPSREVVVAVVIVLEEMYVFAEEDLCNEFGSVTFMFLREKASACCSIIIIIMKHENVVVIVEIIRSTVGDV
jgi:hypothetical protein